MIALPALLVVLLMTLPAPAMAKSFLNVGTINDFILGAWSNAGSWSATQTNCIASAPSRNSQPGDTPLAYNAKVRNRIQNDGFYLYLNGNRNAMGNERILVSFTHTDLLSPPGSSEILANDQFDFHLHLGQLNGCNSGNNSELRIDISGSELAAKVNGDYLGRFELGASNFDNDTKTNFDVSITVERGTEVRISNLDPVNFGQHSGVGNLAADERLCVYSTTASGSYRLSISAAHKDGAGNFYLAENTTSELIPLAVRFSDSPAGTATTPMLNNYFTGIGNTAQDNCGGSNNATLSLFMLEADLQAASTGNYSSTLIILVEPE